MRTVFLIAALATAACGSDTVPPLATADAGVVFTYPIDGMVDVPIGARIVVTFSDPVVAGHEGDVQLVAADGTPVAAMPAITPAKTGVIFDAPPLAPGVKYGVVVGSGIAPFAKNLPASGAPLFSFTTRSETPRSTNPDLVAIQGSSLADFASDAGPLHPVFEPTTIRLVFSEPLDPRTVANAANEVELLDDLGHAVDMTVLAEGIHVSIDPAKDLTAGAAYTLKLGGSITDLDGHGITPHQIVITPKSTRTGPAPIAQVLRTRDATVDPGPKDTRSGADRNVVAISHPLIGAQTQQLLASAVASELGDPQALDGPIAFTIRKGARLHLSGLDVKLDGALPSGLTTGNITIEFLTDADGRLYRNPYQPAAQRPENLRAPVYVDLNLDVAIYADDPGGNAVLAQTILGVQTTGTAIATDGVLAIESVACMELGLLGIARAPSNFVMELITDAAATVDTDTTAPTLLTSYPEDAGDAHPVGAGVELIFDEPIDLARATAGGIVMKTSAGQVVPTVIESHGAAVTVRPVQSLAYAASYVVSMSDVADVAGNAMAATSVAFSTERVYVGGNIPYAPMSVASVHPGAPCALSNGHCAGGQNSDDVYQPFTLPANDPVEVAFTQPIDANKIVLGSQCGAGSVRVEAVDGGGACTAPVPGTLVRRDRSVAFYPDVPWTTGAHYKLTLASDTGGSGCQAGDVCGLLDGKSASFDPLNGMTSGDGGGGNLVVAFDGAPAHEGTFLVAEAGPFTDLNGNGVCDGAYEPLRDENRAALRVTDHSGIISDASWDDGDCDPSTPEIENCMYIQGAMPTVMGALSTTCPLPDGTSVAQCIPVEMSPQVMFGTSITLDATAVGIATLTTPTNQQVMRVREPAAGGPVMGYIVDRNGQPTMVVALDLYMDAPDMSLAVGSHDLHSKPMSLVLTGPVSFLPDGRIAIALTNTADVPLVITIKALGLSGTVSLSLPAGEMKLQLLSRPIRGGQL